MTGVFEIERKRWMPEDGSRVIGCVLDPKDRSNRVAFETAGDEERFGKKREPEVNWSAHGSVDPDAARRYAQQIRVAAEQSETPARDFEPGDVVTFVELAKDRRAQIVDYDPAGDYVSVEDFVPGEYEETRSKASYSLSDVEEIGLRRFSREQLKEEDARWES